MAKGNIGNLLQHFVAMTCAERLVASWDQPDVPIEYIDCYSMSPWETIEDDKWKSGSEKVREFDNLAARGDSLARAFRDAWRTYYAGSSLPADPCQRVYPNTAVLLATAFPYQLWAMRLHDIKDTKQEELRTWFNARCKCSFNVEANWTTAAHLRGQPIGLEHPILLMMDPYKIIKESQINEKNEIDVDHGYLPQNWLRALLGGLYLGLNEQTGANRKAPIVLTLFSYADSNPSDANSVVRAELAKGNWSIDHIQTQPHQLFGNRVVDQAWVATYGLTTPVVGPKMQAAWDTWIA